eukprot:298170_1
MSNVSDEVDAISVSVRLVRSPAGVSSLENCLIPSKSAVVFLTASLPVTIWLAASPSGMLFLATSIERRLFDIESNSPLFGRLRFGLSVNLSAQRLPLDWIDFEDICFDVVGLDAIDLDAVGLDAVDLYAVCLNAVDLDAVDTVAVEFGNCRFATAALETRARASSFLR